MDKVSKEDAAHLENLLKQPGWLVFKDYVRQQWGAAGYGRRLKLAMTTAKSLADVQAVDMANDEINAIMSWPEDQVKRGQPQPEREVSMQRGGA